MFESPQRALETAEKNVLPMHDGDVPATYPEVHHLIFEVRFESDTRSKSVPNGS